MKYRDIVRNTLCIVRGVGVVKAIHPTYASKKDGTLVSVWPNDRVDEFRPKKRAK